MRNISFLLIFFVTQLRAQLPISDYVSFEKGTEVPASLVSDRSVVIFSLPNRANNGFELVGAFESMILLTHKAFVTMGIDPVFYLQDINFIANQSSKQSYIQQFEDRQIEHIILLNNSKDGYQLTIGKFSGDERLIVPDSKVLYMESNQLSDLLLNLGREIRRADHELQNFLIPEKPSYLGGLSIVENTLLQNYPGILRRSKLAVERYAMLDTTKVMSAGSAAEIKKYNQAIRLKNQKLEEIVTSTYPYEFEMIDPMSDDELKRNRYQFVLRSVCTTVETAKRMLDYDVVPGETGFASIIPVMPDQTRVKTIPRNALVCKFYIRQNISKNVHVGVWDADVTWEEALNNMIGNLIQDLRVN